MIIKLKLEEKYTELVKALQSLHDNGRKVDDKLVLKPVMLGKGKRITESEDILLNLMDLSKHVILVGGSTTLNTRKPWKPRRDDSVDKDATLEHT